MTRAAGDKSYYTLRLQRGDNIDPDVEIRLPSVTSIIKATLAAPELVGWAYRQTVESVDMLIDLYRERGVTLTEAFVNNDLDEQLAQNGLRPDDVKNVRADEGQAAHEYLASLASMRRPDPKTPYEKAIENWWFHKAGFAVGAQPEASEAFVYSLRHAYAGTMDLLYWTPSGQLKLVDLKTRSATFWGGSRRFEAYFSDRIQTTAYAGAWEEMTGMSVFSTSILIAMDDGSYIEDSNMVEWKSWEALKSLYDSLPERSKR